MKIVELNRDCLACPSAWIAKTDTGSVLYIRYRWGTLTVRESKDIDSLFTEGSIIFDRTVGDFYDGFMGYQEMLETTGFKLSFDCLINDNYMEESLDD